MENGAQLFAPRFSFWSWLSLVAVPAAEAVIVAADNHWAPFETPVVDARAVKLAIDNDFTADDTIALIRLRVGCASETQSTTQYGRS